MHCCFAGMDTAMSHCVAGRPLSRACSSVGRSRGLMAPGKGECCLWVQMPGAGVGGGHCAAQRSMDMHLGLPHSHCSAFCWAVKPRALEGLGSLMAPHPLPLGLDPACGAVRGGQVGRVCLRVEGLWMFSLETDAAPPCTPEGAEGVPAACCLAPC